MTDSPPSAHLTVPDIDAVLARLADQQAALSRHIDRYWSEAGLGEDGGKQLGLDGVRLARLLSLHSQNAAYLGRLLRDRQAISGEPPDMVEQATNEALDIVGARLGIELIDPALLRRDGPCQPPVEIDDVIADLNHKQDRLARHLARCAQRDDDVHFSRLAAAYSRGSARLGRLLRLRHALAHTTPEEIQDLCDQALEYFASDLEAYHAPQP